MAFFLAILTVSGAIGFAFLVFHVLEGPRLRKLWAGVERSNIDFIRSIVKLRITANTVLSDYDRTFEVKYLVPYEDQWPWDKLFGRVRLRLFVYRSGVGTSDDLMDITSRNSMTISKQKYFYMLLKKQVDTEDRELAIAGLHYLNWRKDIP